MGESLELRIGPRQLVGQTAKVVQRPLQGCRGPFGLRDVAADGRRSHDSIVVALDRRHGERDVDDRPIPPAALGLVVLDSFAILDTGQDDLDLLPLAGHRQQRDGSADHLRGRVAVDSFGPPVPARDDPVQVFADDRVVR